MGKWRLGSCCAQRFCSKLLESRLEIDEKFEQRIFVFLYNDVDVLCKDIEKGTADLRSSAVTESPAIWYNYVNRGKNSCSHPEDINKF